MPLTASCLARPGCLPYAKLLSDNEGQGTTEPLPRTSNRPLPSRVPPLSFRNTLMALHLPASALDIALLTLAALCFGTYRLLSVPAHLRHIPTVPIWPLLWSYLSGEVEEQRVKRLVLPYAKSMQTDVVLVFCLGDWMVQVLDAKVRHSAHSPPTAACC